MFKSDLYDKAEMEFGVTGMGVSKSEKILSVQIDGEDLNIKEKAKQYFENEFASNDITNYKVEILNLKN